MKTKHPEATPRGPNDKDAVSSDIFKTLFGGDPNAVASIFSDLNPFKRKPGDQTLENASEILGNCGSLPEKKRKRRLKTEEEEDDAGLRGSDAIEAMELSGKSEDAEEKNNQKKKKRKRDEVEKEYETKKYGDVERGERAKVGEKRKTVDNPAEVLVPKEGFDDESKLLRTVFVGNLALNVKKKGLIKEFGQFGEVESVRIRSVPITDTKTPRKGAVITKQFHEAADSVHAYVVFKTEESAQASMAHNMAVVGGHHIRVDRACPPRKKMKGNESSLYDHKRTVFVGNLPFDVKDEEVYQLFCGIKDMESSIEGVRIIRDPNNNLGKGFAYVLFKTREAAHAVVKKRNLKLRDRELRLFHAKPDSTPSKRKNPPTPGDKSNSPAKKFRGPESSNSNKKKSFATTSSSSSMSYQGVRASKSGSQKKVVRGVNSNRPDKSFSKTPKGKEGRKEKRPTVAARKEKGKALKEIGVSSQKMGTKRKMDSRTPDSAYKKKKVKKF